MSTGIFCPNCGEEIDASSLPECSTCGYDSSFTQGTKAGSDVEVENYRTSSEFRSTTYFASIIQRGCECCGNQLLAKSYPNCPICGFANSYHKNLNDLDKSRISTHQSTSRLYQNYIKAKKEWDEKERIAAEEAAAKASRSDAVNALSNICVVTNQYGWNPNNSQFELKGSSKTQLAATGAECDSTIHWSDLNIGQYLPEGQTELQLDISFVINGAEQREKCSVKPVKSDNYWHLGVEFTDDYKLYIYLGAYKGDPNAQRSSEIDLNKLFRF